MESTEVREFYACTRWLADGNQSRISVISFKYKYSDLDV